MVAMPATQALFQTVPKKNILGLFEPAGTVSVQRTKEFLKFTKEDIASATNVPGSSVRFDHRMPSEVRDRMVEIATICELVAEHFGSGEKAALWFKISNPLLGSRSPRDMLRMGRFKKLHRFIVEALMGV
jgi:uncharacterized protein (DUF2384 family)